MKTSNIIYQAEINGIKENPVKVGSRRFSKIILFIFMLSWMTVLSSCFVRAPGHEGHDDRHEHHDSHEHHDHDDHHD
jgi:hypothetical protein